MHNSLYYIPFLYLFKTRLKTKNGLISWFIIYAIPVLFSFLFYTYQNIPGNIIISFVSISLIYCLYETGYIYNDTETVKKELNPTIRLDNDQLFYYEKNKLLIYTFRIFLAALLSLFLILYGHVYTYFFLIASWSLLLFYYLYNSTRSIYNLPLHFILVSIRFCSVSLLFGTDVTIFMFLLLLFPIINLLERTSEKRFKTSKYTHVIFNNKAKSRVIYYFIISLLSFILLTHDNTYELNIFFLFSFYYFIYRLSILFFKLKK